MNRLQPVIWTKGTFLNAQYLQSQDRYLDSVLHFQVDSLNTFPWGFSDLRLDQEALTAGDVRVVSATGMFPDGLLFDIPGSDPAPLRRSIADHFQPDQTEADVYLAVPDYRDGGLNVAMPNSTADTRFMANVINLRDENSGLSEKPVQVALKNLRILFEGENLKGHSAMRLARVRRTDAEVFQYDQHFLPPLLDIKASEYLMSIARRLVEIMTSKSAILAGSRRQRNLTLADFTSGDIAPFWLLYTINSHFPLIRHLFETRRGHPRELFQTMLSLAGCLTTFSLTTHPRDLPNYDHDDLEPPFTKLDEIVRELLETVVKSNYISIPLKLQQNYIHAASLADDKYFRNTRMFLAINAEMNEGDLISRVPQLVKLCSAKHIEQLVSQALPGITLTHHPRPPAAIPVKLKYQYFGLTTSGPYWEAVLKARNIAAYVPGDFPAPQLELIILLPDA